MRRAYRTKGRGTGRLLTKSAEVLMDVEIMLPTQLRRRNTGWRPEVVLAVAVMDEALQNLRQALQVTDWTIKKHIKHARLAYSTAQWFEANSRQWPYHFISLCSLLDLEPSAVRVKLRPLLDRAKDFGEQLKTRCGEGACCQPAGEDGYCVWHRGGKDHPGRGLLGTEIDVAV